MKLNEREVCLFASGAGDKEGRLYHKTFTSGSFTQGLKLNHRYIGFKERWFKLKGNLLFYYKVNEYGGVNNKDPIGFFFIEDCKVEVENDSTFNFAFSIAFDPEPEKKHYFGCNNQQNLDDWISALQVASYQKLKSHLNELRSQIIDKTGSDPLAGTPFLNSSVAQLVSI